MAASSISRSRTANSTDSGTSGATIIAKLEKAVFGVLHLMLDSRQTGFWIRVGTVALVIPRFLTTAALAVSPESKLLTFLNLFRIEQFFSVKEDPIIFLAVYTLGLFIVWTSLFCAASTAWFFSTGFFSTFLPALFLRAVVGIFITALLNPLLELFLVPFECKTLSDYFPDTVNEAMLHNIPTNLVLDCTSNTIGGLQITLIILSILSLTAFVPFSIVTKAVYLDTDPVSLDFTAAYTGKLAVYDTLARSILVFATHFLRDKLPVLHAIIVILTMGSLTVLSIIRQPFYYTAMNSLTCSMYAFVTWLAVESLVLNGSKVDDDTLGIISNVMCAFLAVIIPLAMYAPIVHLQYVQKALTNVLELVKEKETAERQRMMAKGSFLMRSDNRPIISATLASPLISINGNTKPYPKDINSSTILSTNDHRHPPGTKVGISDSASIIGEDGADRSLVYSENKHTNKHDNHSHIKDDHSRTVTMSSEENSGHHKRTNNSNNNKEQDSVDAALFPSQHKKHTNSKTRKLISHTNSVNGETIDEKQLNTPHHNTNYNHKHYTPINDGHKSLTNDFTEQSKSINNGNESNLITPTPFNRSASGLDTNKKSKLPHMESKEAIIPMPPAVNIHTATFRPIPGLEFVSVRESSVQSARAARLFHDRPDLVNAMALLVVHLNPRPDILPTLDHKKHVQAGFFPREAIARAESVFEMGLLAFPSDANVTVAYARFLGSFVKDSSRASGMLQRVTKCNPDMEHRFALFSYGRFLEQRRAREDLGEGLDGLGVIAFRQGFASALSAYRQAVGHIASLWKAIETHRRTLRGTLGKLTNTSGRATKGKDSNDKAIASNNDEEKEISENKDKKEEEEEELMLKNSSTNKRSRSRSRQSQNRQRITSSDSSSSSTSSILTTSGIMDRIGRIVSARREAQREFEKLLARYTSAAQVLQSYATFLEHVCMDTLAAQGANARADAVVSGSERPEVGNGGDDYENNRAGSIAPAKSAVGVESAYGGRSTAINSITKSSNSNNSGSNTQSGSRGGSQSQGGASSSKSGSSTTFTRGNTTGTEAVVRLRSRMQWGMILVAVFAISIFIATRIVLTDFTSLVQAIYEAGQRRYTIVAGAFYARSASLATMDNILSPEEMKKEWDLARSWLLQESMETTEINTYLYDTTDLRSTILFERVRKLYDEPWFPILYISGTLNITRYGGFQEAVQTYVGTLPAIANLPKDVVKYPLCDHHPAWRFVLDNWSGIFKSANLISTVYVDRAFELGETFISVSWVLFSLVILVLYILLFHIFWPSVKLVQSSNAGVISIIEAIPLNIVIAQVKKYSMLEISLHAETDKVLDDDADSTQDIEEDESDSSNKNNHHSHHRKKHDDSRSYSSHGSDSTASNSSRSRSRSNSDSTDSRSSDSEEIFKGNDPRSKPSQRVMDESFINVSVSSPVANRNQDSTQNTNHTRINTNDINNLKPETLISTQTGLLSPAHDPVPIGITTPPATYPHRNSGSMVNVLAHSDLHNTSQIPGAIATPPGPTTFVQQPISSPGLSRVPSMVYAPPGMYNPNNMRIPPPSALRSPTTNSNQIESQTMEGDNIVVPITPLPHAIKIDDVNTLENVTSVNSARYSRRRDKDGSKVRRLRNHETTTVTVTRTTTQKIWDRLSFFRRINTSTNSNKLSPLLKSLTFRTAMAMILLGTLQALATGLNTSQVKSSTYTASSINYAGYRRELAITCIFHARELLIGPDILGDYRFSAQDFRYYLDDFQLYHRGLLYGDENLRLLSSLGESTEQDNLLFSPQSSAFELLPYQNLSISQSYASTASTQGLNYLLLQFFSVLEVFLSRYEPWWGTDETRAKYAATYFNGTTPPFDPYVQGWCHHNLTCIHADSDFAQIEMMDFGSLDNLLEISMNYYLEQVTARSDRGLWVQITVLVLNLAVLTVFYFFVTERQFYYLNQEAQRTLELVRLIPVAAIDSSSKLRAIINCNDNNNGDNMDGSNTKSSSRSTKNTMSDESGSERSNTNNSLSHRNTGANNESSASSGQESNDKNKHSTSSGSLRSKSKRNRGNTPKSTNN